MLNKQENQCCLKWSVGRSPQGWSRVGISCQDGLHRDVLLQEVMSGRGADGSAGAQHSEGYQLFYVVI